MRRRAHVRLTEEDLFHLLSLYPNERVVSVWAEPAIDCICIGIEGDETADLPETAPGTASARIERPYSIVKLREELREIVAAHLRAESGLSDECLKAIGQRVVKEVLPSLTVSVPPAPTVP